MNNQLKKYEIIQCVQMENQNVTIEDTIRAIKNAGFDGVFLQIYNKDIEFSQLEQFSLCKQLNLSIPFCHLHYNGFNDIWIEGENGDKLVNGYLKDLELCDELKIPMVVMHLVNSFIAPPPSKIGLKRLETIIKYAKSKNIKIAFENTKISGYIEYVLDNLDYDNIGICYDSGHCHCYFDDEFNWNKFKNKIFTLHLHDNDKSGDQHLLPFDGTINWNTLIDNLIVANYSGPISLESCYRNNYLQISLDDFYKESYTRAKQIAKMISK